MNLISKILFVLVVANLSLGMAAQAETKKLVLLNWSNYVDPQILKDFEIKFNEQRRYGILYKINDVFFFSIYDQELSK